MSAKSAETVIYPMAVYPIVEKLNMLYMMECTLVCMRCRRTNKATGINAAVVQVALRAAGWERISHAEYPDIIWAHWLCPDCVEQDRLFSEKEGNKADA